ncbi:desmoplakin-B isoform X2 [Hoplias malabaricus]
MIEQQLISHNKFHSSIQRSLEMERAREELRDRGDKASLNFLEQEWDSLQKMSFARSAQLHELQNIIEEISREIMWVNDREEAELVFDWGNKNIDVYIPKKQESYSRLMSELEEKEKDLNKLKLKVDSLLMNNHPASDKIEAYMETLQTQWLWLLQITKCIHVHLKENAAYSQFFTEANETYNKLQKQHETIRKKFTCDKTTPLQNLQELLKDLERERDRLFEQKPQVQHLVNKSKTIVRLKPRNPEEKCASPVIVQALCDFRQDQKVICKGDEGILKDNSERSKWHVTGPGGLDMQVPSVCLLVPPPNPLSTSLASKNEQYYEAIMSLWNQLYINIKSLISWQYCLQDIQRINSLTMSMLAQMRPEEYRSIIKSLETHYQEFQRTSSGSDIFGEDDKKTIETQYSGAQKRYDDLVVQLPTYTVQQVQKDVVDFSAVKADASPLVSAAPPATTRKVSYSVNLLSELDALQLKLKTAESALTTHLHIPLGQDAPTQCAVHITRTQAVQKDVETMKREFQSLQECVLEELEGMKDADKAQFLSSQLGVINQRLHKLGSQTDAYLIRLKAMKSLLQSLLQAEDVVKVYEARLTERDTTSLDPAEVQAYQSTLRIMRTELEQKESILGSLESELNKACRCNEQIYQDCQKCDFEVCQYSEHASLLSDRWKRIQAQINSRLGDLDSYLQQLLQYLHSSSNLSAWIDGTRSRIDAQQTSKTDDITVFTRFLNQQKALNSEIMAKREMVEDVQKDGDVCMNSIKGYEVELASYSAGLETLLNIPIKRTVLQSPSTAVIKEVSTLHARYLELLTHSSDYCKHLGESLKNLEQLKMKNTRIDLLEEELRLLKADIQDRDANNASLQNALSQYQLQLNESQEHLLSLEEVKRSQAMQCSAAQDSLNSSQSQLQGLMEELQNFKLLLEKEKAKKKIVEERYTSQQEEHEQVMRKLQRDLEGASWAKIELEKAVADRTLEVERLRKQLEEEAQNVKEAQVQLAKVRQQHSTEISEVKQVYESQILVTQTNMQKLSQQRETDCSSMQLEVDRLKRESKELQEELRRLQRTLGDEEAQRRRTENLLQQQTSASTVEARKNSELETQIQLLISQKGKDENKWKEMQENTMRALMEKNNEVSSLKRSLEEELRKKRALEVESSRLEKELADLRAKHTTCSQELIQLRSSQQELMVLRVDLESQHNEKNRAEQNIARLQARIQELQEELKQLEMELEQQGRMAQEEAAKRRRTEVQLENTSQAMREYTSTITTLRKSLEDTSIKGKQAEEECRRLKDALDRNMKEHCFSSQRFATLEAEMKALRLQLVQEQGRVRESSQRYEALQRRMEEITQALNEKSALTEQLKKRTDTLTNERLQLEQELRAVRQEHDALLQGRRQDDEQMNIQIKALQQQLQNSQHSQAEHDSYVQQLSQEREKLRQEIQNIQKQACETSSLIQTSQSQCTELRNERDALIKKMNTLEQDIKRMREFEIELNRIKLSLESELRLKTRLQEENDTLRKEFSQWKKQCEIQEDNLRQHSSQCMVLEAERNSLRSELERLQARLKEMEEQYSVHLQAQKHIELQTSISPSTLVFDGVRKTVTAHELHACGVIDKTTLDQLIKGQKCVQDVAVDIKLNLKGTGAIAGLTAGPEGNLTFTEAKRDNLISKESANKLLEAQAATGHIIDPRANVKMTVEEACLCGLVEEEDKAQLLTAEAACIGFRDPETTKPLSVSQAMRKGLINQDTALRLLQAQEATGGILDPVLSVYLPKDIARDRDIIDRSLYEALNAKPNCYTDPGTSLSSSYVTLKKQCKIDPNTGLLLLPFVKDQMMVQGLRGMVSMSDLVEAKLLEASDIDQLREGKITSQDIEHRLRAYLRGSTCIAGVYDEANKRILPIYQAKKEGLLRPGTTLELLEAQAASGFMIDPVNNQYYTVEEACKKHLVGVEFKDKLLSAERAVTGYKDPGTDKIISLFEAIERGLIEKGHGIRLLEAQIASGGIIDPKQSHRIDVDVAFQRGYFGEEMNQILKDEGDDTKGFFDPNTQDNLTYLQLKERCITDDKTGLVLLPLHDKSKIAKTQKNTTRKTRVVIVDPDTNKEMTVREAYDKQLIDYETYLELTEQESEWEEMTVTASDGTSKLVITDRKTGLHYDLKELLEKGVIDQDTLNKYSSGVITLTQFVEIISSQTSPVSSGLSSSTSSSCSSSSSQTTVQSETVSAASNALLQQSPTASNAPKRIASMSITLTSSGVPVDEQSPVGAIFDTEKSEKLSIHQALKRGLLDSITAQRLLEAQACTGGIVNPENGRRISIQEATRLGIIDDEMANRLKPAQKAYIGFEDLKTKRKMSAAEAVKEKWLPYEAGQRFLEFQLLTGGLFDPEHGRRLTLDEALRLGWLDGRTAQKLLETRHHAKALTCPKTKLRISYKEAMDACMLEEKTGVRMLPAAATSSQGISSPYNTKPSSAPGSRDGSRRGSVDRPFSTSSSSRYSSFSYRTASFSTRSLS